MDAAELRRRLDLDDLTEHDLIENGGSCTQEWINGWNARNEFLRDSLNNLINPST